MAASFLALGINLPRRKRLDSNDFRVDSSDGLPAWQRRQVFDGDAPLEVDVQASGVRSMYVEYDGRTDACQGIRLLDIELLESLMRQDHAYIELPGFGQNFLKAVRMKSVGLVDVDMERSTIVITSSAQGFAVEERKKKTPDDGPNSRWRC